MSPRGSLERRAAVAYRPPCWLGAEHGTRAAAGAWLAGTNTGGLGNCKLHSQPQNHFLHRLCCISSCAEGGHGVRLGLSLAFVQAHCRVVCASPCPNGVSQQVTLAVGDKKNAKRVILSNPVKGKGDSSLAMKFFSLQKFPASIFFCSLSLSQPVGALRDAALPQGSAAL